MTPPAALPASGSKKISPSGDRGAGSGAEPRRGRCPRLFVVTGLFASFTGVLFTLRYGSARADNGLGF
ncbi:hypothetical protein AB0D51_22755, partial [Streptomyces sp. NPDC048312]